jgi:trk system potassium uptake protein TrkH
MYSNKPFFGSRTRSKLVDKTIRHLLDYLLLSVLLFMLIKSIIVIGYNPDAVVSDWSANYYRWMFSFVAFIYLLRAIICIGFRNFSFDLILFSSFSVLLFLMFTLDIDRAVELLNNHYFYSLVLLALFIFEFSMFDIRNMANILNPAQLFMLSFAFLIITGAVLLELPNATTAPITFIDALFTSTSAICVTGLTVIDTATGYTDLGKTIILMLIQVGGIGIMTFTSFFGFFFKRGTTSFSERFVLSDMLSQDNVSQIWKTLAKVILITFLIEGIGATFVYLNLDRAYFTDVGENIKFSVFHAISAFCNAGFSTLTDNLNDFRVRDTQAILYALGFLIILGGIGFPILFNLYTFIKYQIQNLISMIRFQRKKDYIPMIISVNSRLVIYTTFFLIIIGTVFFFIFENDNSLKGMDLASKIAHSFFGSVTPRTAGFNSVNMSQLSIATVAMTIFLMWVGASPVSTGGGIKTSTFAIAVLNALRIARLKNHIEFHKREFHERSVDRAFAIIILSIVILGCSSLVMYLIEPELGALKILFECVSAFGTVGLSLGITPGLTDLSKLLLILLMFMGRMGILTLLFALLRRTQTSAYRYPKENIVIT